MARAAPVTINGKRGNVAVVIQLKGKKKYHVHRILMPDGSEFIYDRPTQNAELTGDSIARQNPRKRLSISSASNDSISDSSEKINPSVKKSSRRDSGIRSSRRRPAPTLRRWMSSTALSVSPQGGRPQKGGCRGAGADGARGAQSGTDDDRLVAVRRLLGESRADG